MRDLLSRFKPNPVLQRYELLERIGAGGMGTVRKARDRVLKRIVAIKTIVIPESHTGSQKKRFLQEARAASALNHPNIITVYDFIEHRHRCSIVMEMVDGRPLSDLVAEGPMDPAEALLLVATVAGAMEWVHSAGILHRDLKPANIVVQGDGSPKILDFGLAAFRVPRPSPDSRTRQTDALLTGVGQVVGTPAYMSPEQIRGELVDQRTDVFSLGCVLYEALTGKRPFHGDTLTGLLAAILTEFPPLPSVARSGIPPEVDEVVLRALEKGQDDRFASMTEFRDALLGTARRLAAGKEHLASRLEAPPRPAPPPARFPPPSPLRPEAAAARRPARRSLALSVAGLFLVTTVAGWWIITRSDGPRSLEARVSLSGSVDGPEGPVEGARVTVDGYPFEAFTSSLGQFSDVLPDALPGENVRLRVSHPRFQTRTLDVDLKSGRTDSLHVSLIPIEPANAN